MCLRCAEDLPFTRFDFSGDNALARRLRMRMEIHKAIALLYYGSRLSSGKLIKQLKYHGKKKVSAYLGAMLVPYIAKDKPDMIIPIPLHPRKKRMRGYNQVTGMGKILAEKLNVAFNDKILMRKKYTESQTRKSPLERSRNVENIYTLKHPGKIRGKHILLIDDVITTGSTIANAAHLLQKHGAGKISVAALAFKFD